MKKKEFMPTTDGISGVVVDFQTLYNPPALAGAILAYTPFFDAIYVSRRSLQIAAESFDYHKFVPISGYKLLEDGLDFWGVEWLRNWCRKTLKCHGNSLVSENLYASILLIHRSIDTGILKVLPNDEDIISSGGEILKGKNLPSGITWDTMISSQGNEVGFCFSPDLGHGFALGAGVVLGDKNDLVFSTCNPCIEQGLDLLCRSFDGVEKKLGIIQSRSVRFTIPPSPSVEDLFKLRDMRVIELSQFSRVMESESKEDLIFFTPKVNIVAGIPNIELELKSYSYS